MPVSEDISVGQLTIRFLVDGSDSNGSAAIFEVEVPPGARVPAPHSHDAYEETMYGLEGTLSWTVDGTSHQVGPGDHVCIMRGEVHGFVNESDQHAKQLAIVSPAVIGPDFFRDMAEVVNAGGPPDPQALGAVMRRHGLTPATPAA
jgi:quercetin dioxygenase-like cupin family protein